MVKYFKLFLIVFGLLLLVSVSKQLIGQGLTMDDDENWDKFKPSASFFIQPMNVIGYYPRIHLGMAFITPNGINISLMTAFKFPGLPKSTANYYTVREFRPEISYFLLKPHHKVNLRVGLEVLLTRITEKRYNGSFINTDESEVYYSVATLVEKRKGIRLIAAMVLAKNRSFVFEPYIGIGVGIRNIEYIDVDEVPKPPPLSISQGLDGLFHINLWDTSEKSYVGSRYYFMPTIGVKIGFRIP